MTDKSIFIAGDWGTSNLRLYLCQMSSDWEATILDTQFGPGISQLNRDFEDTLFRLIQDWLDQYESAPVILSGMIGSTIGWKDAPYLKCPVGVDDIAQGRVSFNARGIEISILAGLRTENPLGAPDVMRGEELQMLGWMKTQNSATTRQLFALPGTHNKWTLVESDRITNFLTAFTGELYALLRSNSILISEEKPISFNKALFMQGVEAVQSLSGAHLVHALFATRSKQVLGEMASSDASSYLSGLITAADILGATTLFQIQEPVMVIGEPALADHYVTALNHFGWQAQTCAPAEIAVAGFAAVYQQLHQ